MLYFKFCNFNWYYRRDFLQCTVGLMLIYFLTDFWQHWKDLAGYFTDIIKGSNCSWSITEVLSLETSSWWGLQGYNAYGKGFVGKTVSTCCSTRRVTLHVFRNKFKNYFPLTLKFSFTPSKDRIKILKDSPWRLGPSSDWYELSNLNVEKTKYWSGIRIDKYLWLYRG